MKKKILTAAIAAALGLGALTFGVTNYAPNASADKAAAAPSHSENDGDNHGAKQEGKEEHKEEEGALRLTEEQIEAAGIVTVPASSRTMSSVVAFPGEIRFDENRTAHIVPRVPGVVEKVLVELGQSVKKGQMLAIISSQQISDLRAELDGAQRRAELARSTLAREESLFKEKISAEQDYQQARQSYQEAQISVANAQQKISAIGANGKSSAGNRYELVAPFDAVVVEKHLVMGELVSEATNAFILSDLSKVWATFTIPPKDLTKVLVGRTVKVASPDLVAEVDGQVDYVGSLLGEQTRSAPVRVTLHNPDGAWRPGLFVNVEVSGQASLAKVAVPEIALQSVNEKTSVFERTAEGFQLVPVKVGRKEAGYVEILDGLKEGAKVAATGSYSLKSELGKESAEHSD